MKRLLVALLLLVSTPVWADPGGTIPNFQLLDQEGRAYDLYDYSEAPAVVLYFVTNGCPIVRRSLPRLQELAEEYERRGVVFLLINPQQRDTRESVREEARRYGIRLPILLDRTQLVTRTFSTRRVGEVVVLNPKNWHTVYQGAVDDRFGYGSHRPARNHYLRDALEGHLEGRPVTPARTETKGCLIEFEPLPEVDYARDVAPLIAARCLPCHSPDHIGPFDLARYEDLAGREAMFIDVLLSRRMPPWSIDPKFGKFVDQQALSDVELRTLITWLRGGAVRGEGKDPLLEASQNLQQDEEWPLGPPDLTVQIPHEVSLSADGLFEYVDLSVPLNLPQDVWVRAAQVKPGNEDVLHHCVVYVDSPGSETPDWTEGYLAWYVPSAEVTRFPEESGKFLPKGSSLRFQLHYVATGKPESDRTSLGLYFSKERPKKEYRSAAAVNRDLVIPAGASRHSVVAEYTLKEEVWLDEMAPHMHFRGRAFRFEAHFPDGRKEVLLSVPRYRFEWQHVYRLKEPLRLPRGTRIVCHGVFDNSERNASNPDPKLEVKWGDRIWDEMMVGTFSFIRAWKGED